MKESYVIPDNPSYCMDFRYFGTKRILGLQGLWLGWCPNPKNPHRVTPTVSVANAYYSNSSPSPWSRDCHVTWIPL